MTLNTKENVTRKMVFDALRPIIDPDLGLSIVDLGLIYDVRLLDGGAVEIDMTLTSMGCPAGAYLHETVRQCVEKLAGVREAAVTLVWDPPWSEERVEPDLRFALGLTSL
jgi:metal-sulfur cluster biosynthetic enzyme